MIKLAIKSLITLLFLILVLFLLVVASGLKEASNKNYDYAVVFGNKVSEDGKPSPRLAARLDRAKVIWKQEKCSMIIVSGGIGKEGFDEANVMKDYLVSEGVPKEMIIEDNKGVTTWSTALNTKSIIQANSKNSAIAISQYFHLKRCRLAFEKVGINEVGSSYARYFEWRDIYATLREIPALIKYALK